VLQSLLGRYPLANIRRNHGLEHATIHLLSQSYPDRTFIGRSDIYGFLLYGAVETDTLSEFTNKALERLRAGDGALAIHPNCGTNLVTSALLASGATLLAFMGSEGKGWRRRLERFPLAVANVILALIIARPLGTLAQEKLTTDGKPANLRVISVKRIEGTGMTLHRVLTRS
jgi:hypothetical protein